MNQFVEIIRLKVDAAGAADFKELRHAADEALVPFDGFLGSELLKGSDGVWTLLVRWNSQASVEAAQALTLAKPGLDAISAWIASATEFISFETVESVRSFRPRSE